MDSFIVYHFCWLIISFVIILDIKIYWKDGNSNFMIKLDFAGYVSIR